MFVQIDNVGFINKGAELMLHAVKDRLNGEPNLKISVVKGKNCFGTRNQIGEAGLFQFANFQRFKIRWEVFFDDNRLYSYGLVKKKNIQVLLDAGGFQFGDQWINGYSKESNKKLREYYINYKRNNTKIIFLPQAFGPFHEALSQERIKMIFNIADLFYARDEISYQHLVQLFGESNKIRIAPDFTSLVKPDITLKNYQLVKNRVCIIVNSKMVSHTSDEVSMKYIDFIIAISKQLMKKGESLLFLNHEGEEDWVLIEKIVKILGNDTRIASINGLDGYQVKAIIGYSKLLISSRFHGVVSGLNQKVPTFCTSWSHKYEELLKDYKVNDNVLNVTDIGLSVDKVLQGLENPEKFAPKQEFIDNIQVRTLSMWAEILDYINNK